MLTQTRAADRATMAARVRALAESHGFTAEVKPASWNPSEELCVAITTKRGLILSMDFNRRATWGFLGHWHIATDSDARLKLSFGNVNPHHQSKATLYGGDDFEAFMGELDRKLRQVATEDVFDAEREADEIAKHGTAAQRTAQWESWRAEEDAKREALRADGWAHAEAAGLIYGAPETVAILQARHGEAQLVPGLGYWVRAAVEVAA